MYGVVLDGRRSEWWVGVVLCRGVLCSGSVLE